MRRHVDRQMNRSRAMREEKTTGHREGQKGKESDHLETQAKRQLEWQARQSFYRQLTSKAPGGSR